MNFNNSYGSNLDKAKTEGEPPTLSELSHIIAESDHRSERREEEEEKKVKLNFMKLVC